MIGKRTRHYEGEIYDLDATDFVQRPNSKVWS